MYVQPTLKPTIAVLFTGEREERVIKCADLMSFKNFTLANKMSLQ